MARAPRYLPPGGYYHVTSRGNNKQAWLWSSYRSCAGLALAEPFLQESTLLKLFGRTPVDARRAYRDFVAQALFQESDTARAV